MLITLIFEVVNAACSINEAKQQWNEGILVKSREEFIEKTINAVVMALSRSSCSIGGMIVGQFFIPVPFVGSVIGLLLGTLAGHYAGKGFSKLISSPIAAFIDKCMSKNQSLQTKED